MSKSDIHEVLHRAVRDGAAVMPNYLDTAEVALLSTRNQDRMMLERRVPRLGRLIAELATYLEDPAVSLSTNTILAAPPGGTCGFHTDVVAPRGITLLVPFRGPSAAFYYSPHVLQTYPNNMPDSQEFVYGQGDIAVLRQAISVSDGVSSRTRQYNQTYHLGVAAAERELLLCDVMSSRATLPLEGPTQ